MKALLLALLSMSAVAKNRTACDDVPPRQAKIRALGTPSSRAFCAPGGESFSFETQAKRFLPLHTSYMSDASLPEEARLAVKASYEQMREAFRFLLERRQELCAEQVIDAALLLRPVAETQISVAAIDSVDAALKKHLDTLRSGLEKFDNLYLGSRDSFTMKGKVGAAGTHAFDTLSANFREDLGEPLLAEVKSNLPSGILARYVAGENEPFGVFSTAMQAFAKEMVYFDEYSGATFDLRLCAQKQAADHAASR